MYRGKKTFICRECGNRFTAPDIEYAATVLSMPQQCPKCGSNKTRPISLLPGFIADMPYKGLWKKREE